MDATDETVYTWSRDEVSSCNCSEKSYRHVHCRCLRCQGKATSRKTELRHWSEARLCEHATTIDFCSDSSDQSDNEPTTMDFDDKEKTSEKPAEAAILEEEGQIFEPEAMDVVPPDDEPIDHHSSWKRRAKEDNVNPLRQIILKAVLNAMNIMEDSGASVKTFEDILDYGKKMLFTSVGDEIDVDILSTLWPRNWSAAQLLLKQEGFCNAKEYYKCICRESKEMTRNGKTTTKYQYSHSFSILESKSDLCPNCDKPGYIKYYYLGLNEKVKNWFRNEAMCKKMLSHWQEKDHWLGRTLSWPVKNEIWDGQRWVDLEWFWNPNNTWCLPTTCVNCKAVISTETLHSCSKDENGMSLVNCPECFETFLFKIKTTCGSPLNLALIGHWDAWQPFQTSFRSCGSIEISIANMYKADRAHKEEVYVVGFVPCTSVPNDVPESFDPFLEPLMKDLVTGFIDGFKVPYPSEVSIDNFQADEMPIIRVLLLCWAGDHPGQCEIGKFLNQGKCGCRRCKMIGKQGDYSHHYYYGDNRFHCRYPWDIRDIRLEQENLYDLDNETRITVRKKQSSERGFTGTSLLHKYLYPLYGFDILQHMVIDVFHTVPLNLCKNQVQRTEIVRIRVD